MNSWSRTRKRIILGILILAVVVLVGFPMYLLFYEKPNCFDGKQNGDETGVDCGGSCQLLCRAESLPLLLKGDPRVLTLATSTYQAVALVENVNSDAEIYRAEYTISIYSAASAVPVRVIEGLSFVPAGQTFAIFEGPFTLEPGIVPSRAILEWKEPSLVWRKRAKPAPELKIRDIKFAKLDSAPRLEAYVENPTLDPSANIDLTAIISDSDGNIFAASKTFIESLMPGEESQVIFTWPRRFEKEAASAEILVRIFPDRSFIR